MNTLITHTNKEIRTATLLSLLEEYNSTGADALYFTTDNTLYNRKNLPVRNKKLGQMPYETRISISDMGFAPMAYILGLDDSQTGALSDVFVHCSKNATPIHTLSDLIKAMMVLSNKRVVEPEKIEPAYTAAVALRNESISQVFGKSNLNLQSILELDCVTAFINTSFVASNKRVQAAIFCSVVTKLLSIAPDAPCGSDAALAIAFDWDDLDFCNMTSHMQKIVNLILTFAPKKGIALIASKNSEFVRNENCKGLFKVIRPKGYSGHSFMVKPQAVPSKRHYVMAIVLMTSPFLALTGMLL